jgi:energy-converting hydrogenase Eha subunit A
VAHALTRPRAITTLAALVPFVVYALTASGHGYWLDGGEFTAAAIGLDIAHPPGHPLASLWGKLFALLPVGPLPYRVALGQAVAAALAVGCVQVALRRSLTFSAELPTPVVSALSLAGAWSLAGAYGFWFQGVRAEVYALQALLVCYSLERLSKIACDASDDDPRPLYQACLALGLGLANHHFIAVLALPALLVALVRVARRRVARVVGTALAAGAIGLFTYVYLPLRALGEPLMDLGHPVTLRDFAWVVSAQVYARKIGSAAIQPLGERFADLAVILVENFSGISLLLGVLGAYVSLTRRASRPLAYVWLCTALVSLGGRAWLNPVRANPDVLGYMMPGFAALLALALIGLAALLESLPKTRLFARLTIGCASLLVVLGLSQFAAEAERASLRDFHATDDFADLRIRALPTRALVILTRPESVFQLWQSATVEQLRADVTLLPLPFVGYGGLGTLLARRHPELAAAIAAYDADGTLPRAQLQALAEQRPVYVELDTTGALALFSSSLSERLLARVLATAPTPDQLAHAAQARTTSFALLRARLGTDVDEVETRRQLLWSCYLDALYFAAHRSWQGARDAIEDGLTLAPHTRELRLLRRALDEHERATPERALDLRPFLVGERAE